MRSPEGDARRVYAVIERLLAKNAQERLRSAAEVRAALSGSAPPTRAAPSRAGDDVDDVACDLLAGDAVASQPEQALLDVCGWCCRRIGSFSTQVRIRSTDGGGVVGRVGRFFRGGSDPFRETWDDGADGFATARERRIAPGDPEPGSYRLTLQIEDGRGRDAEASHDFTIVER